MKKLLILLLITIALFFTTSPKTFAATTGDLAILIEIDVVNDEATLYDWNNDLFIVEPLDVVNYVGNLFSTLLYDSAGPIWELADPMDQEDVIYYLTTIFNYFKTANDSDIYDNGFTTGYSIGYNAGYSKGYNDGYTAGYNYGISVAEGDSGYADGYGQGLIDGSGLPTAEDMYDFGYSEGYDIGFDEGAALPNDQRFYRGIEKWLVPAIIVVIFLGGAVTIIARKRKEE